jgi:hypothetical protein
MSVLFAIPIETDFLLYFHIKTGLHNTLIGIMTLEKHTHNTKNEKYIFG